ncbi:Uncharacterised protein [uncultured archaeon]|nr:Uncharacterised protein [uncultured archaeon]
MKTIDARVSGDGRIRTGTYFSDGLARFCVAEKTGAGTLVTEFTERGEVLDQVCLKVEDHKEGLLGHLKGVCVLNLLEAGDGYERVGVNAKCEKCGGAIIRELDTKRPAEIRTAPVVPIFICKACGAKYYSLTDNYLRKLARENRALFSAGELKEIDADEHAAVRTLQEYIIRIFASKRIGRLKMGN